MAVISRKVDIGGGCSRVAVACDCGVEIVCRGFTNTCDCGRDYNMSGSLLAPRSQWGEETGESLADILAADTDVGSGNLD